MSGKSMGSKSGDSRPVQGQCTGAPAVCIEEDIGGTGHLLGPASGLGLLILCEVLEHMFEQHCPATFL